MMVRNQQIELIKNGGVWRFTPGAAWTDGDYTLTVKVEDKAGNTNYSAPLTGDYRYANVY
ncbi:large repetitive protein [Salmonella enterica subsp. enterica]|uniref:Large repetitive protein n=1 Tax=Salmonella enterica I TaxID=59201 RepID=A0A447TPU9_SALET|nr:large repetitive protein [Salmonella enterica subsp. enterica]